MNLYVLLFVTLTFIGDPKTELIHHEIDSVKHPRTFKSLESCEFVRDSVRGQSKDKFVGVCVPFTKDDVITR